MTRLEALSQMDLLTEMVRLARQSRNWKPEDTAWAVAELTRLNAVAEGA